MHKKAKRNRHTARKTAADLLLYFAGGFLYAAAVNVFLAPNEILLGGFTGVATVLNHLLGTPIGTVVFLLNVPLFVIADFKFGFSFIIRTVIATFFSSVLIDVTALFLPVYAGDRLLSSLFERRGARPCVPARGDDGRHGHPLEASATAAAAHVHGARDPAFGSCGRAFVLCRIQKP